AQRFLGPPESALAVVELAHPGHDPPGTLLDAATPKLREAIEQPVEDEGPEEQLGRVVNGQEVLRADVLTAAEVIGDRHLVVVERRVEQAAATPDVQDEGNICLAQYVPERIEVGMGRCELSGSRGGDHHRGTAPV